MRKPSDRAVSTLVAIFAALFIAIVIAAGTYVAHQGALGNYNMQGMTPNKQKPVFLPNPLPNNKPWK